MWLAAERGQAWLCNSAAPSMQSKAARAAGRRTRGSEALQVALHRALGRQVLLEEVRHRRFLRPRRLGCGDEDERASWRVRSRGIGGGARGDTRQAIVGRACTSCGAAVDAQRTPHPWQPREPRTMQLGSAP